jgi:thymidylate kinase
MVLQRINPRGGLAIAVIGADGSGKSTVIANLQSTFKKKLDVYSIYFGSGAGKVSWPRKFLSALKKAKSAKKKKQSAKTEQRVSGKKKGYITNVYKCIQSLIVANEKRKNLKRMLLAKKKGMLVICDRYPQNQILGYNDGPMLQSFAVSSSPLFRMMAKKEAGIYKQFEETTPDIIFKLIAEAEVVEARKPGETPLEILKAKIEGVKQLNFPDSCEVITVNAEEPLEKVLFTIKKKIWEAYH